MDKFDIKGIWRGEYVYDDRFEPRIVKTPIPFLLKVKSVDPNGLFEGMCQDSPEVSQIDFPADIYGKWEEDQLTFSKRYPKTLFRDGSGKLMSVNEPHPDIIYQAKIGNSDKLLGTWRIEKTFRKLEGKVVEIGSITGVWWMVRL